MALVIAAVLGVGCEQAFILLSEERICAVE